MRRWALALTLSFLLPSGLAGQQQAQLARGFDLERKGDYAGAAAVYREVLVASPASLTALLGLERVLVPLNRLPDIIPEVRAALAANPVSPPIYGLAVRAWASAEEPDSVEVLVSRWSKTVPGDETPYREWGATALARQDRLTATNAYQMGRQRLGRPDALAAEMAQLAILDGDYPRALREWLLALKQLPAYRPAAAAALAQAPEPTHAGLLKTLDAEQGVEAHRLAIDLRARWGDPLGAAQLMLASLPADSGQAVEALQQLLIQLAGLTSRAGYEAKGRVSEALADRLTAQQPRLRLDAARAYAQAGDPASARRMLQAIVADPSTDPEVAAGASAAVIGLLVEEGKVEDADQQLERHRATLSVDDAERLRRAIVRGWIHAGELTRAEHMMASDSTVEGLALSGQIELFRGNLAAARADLQAAGPFVGSREEVTDRASLLALLQPIESDSLPSLGAALLSLNRGDTVPAVAGLEATARQLSPTGGRAELLLMAGRLRALMGPPAEAERLLRLAIAPEVPATAASAQLELARLLIRLERRDEAVQTLESLILDYPKSSLVPQARRLLDVARGTVPRT